MLVIANPDGTDESWIPPWSVRKIGFASPVRFLSESGARGGHTIARVARHVALGRFPPVTHRNGLGKIPPWTGLGIARQPTSSGPFVSAA